MTPDKSGSVALSDMDDSKKASPDFLWESDHVGRIVVWTLVAELFDRGDLRSDGSDPLVGVGVDRQLHAGHSRRRCRARLTPHRSGTSAPQSGHRLVVGREEADFGQLGQLVLTQSSRKFNDKQYL